MDELRKYINQCLSAIGTPHTEHERGQVEAYCDVLGKINGRREKAKKHRSGREVFDTCVSRLSDMPVQE